MADSTVDEMQQVLANAECIVDKQTVNSAVEKLADTISQQLHNSNPLVLVVMNGGLYFAGMLLSSLRFPMELDYLHLSRYGKHTRGQNCIWKSEPQCNMHGRHVLIVDDILDEGVTLKTLVDYCQREGALSVQSAVLVKKNHQRCVDGVKAEYQALTVEDKFIFGCGMDYKNYWRNLPEIYALKEDAC